MDFKAAAEKARKMLSKTGKLLSFRGAGKKNTSYPSVVLPPSAGSELGIHFLTENLLTRSSYLLIVGTVPGEPLEQFSEVDIDGVRYVLTKIEALKPKDDVILYFVWTTR